MAQPLLNLVVQLRSWKLEAQLLAALPRLRSHLRVLKAGDRMYSAHGLVRVIASCLSELRYERPYGLKEEQWTSFTCLRHLTLTRYRFKGAFPTFPNLRALSLHGVNKNSGVAMRAGWRAETRSHPLELIPSAIPNLRALYLSETLSRTSKPLKTSSKLGTAKSTLPGSPTPPSPCSSPLNSEDVKDGSLPSGIPSAHLQLDSCPDLSSRYSGNFHHSFRLHCRLIAERDDILKECEARGIDVVWRFGSRKPEDDLEVSHEFWQYAREEKAKKLKVQAAGQSA